jgi:alpha-L-fucosidase
MHRQIRELLTQYGPIAGIWFDPIMPYYHRPDLFPIEETYAMIRAIQPQCLISFKQGATGTEDFASCEKEARSLGHRLEDAAARRASEVWEMNKNKPNEVCDTFQQSAWGHNSADDGRHRSAEEVWEMLERARQSGCNLLLNTGPLPDGSIPDEDAKTLRSVGLRLGKEGFP